MDAGEPLARYLRARLRELFRRRYARYWRDFNVFLDGAAISKKQTPVKTPTHFETWLTGPPITDFPMWVVPPPTKGDKHWGICYSFRYYGRGSMVDTSGHVKVIDHLVQVYSGSWADNRLATAGGDYWSFELADPYCIEKVIGLFKRMFPIPQARK